MRDEPEKISGGDPQPAPADTGKKRFVKVHVGWRKQNGQAPLASVLLEMETVPDQGLADPAFNANLAAVAKDILQAMFRVDVELMPDGFAPSKLILPGQPHVTAMPQFGGKKRF